MLNLLILSQHFYPSPAVGAKRISELACRLRDLGWRVTVVTAPADRVPELVDRIRGIEVLDVPRPRKLYPLLAYWPKHLWALLRVRRGQRAAEGEAAVAISVPAQPTTGQVQRGSQLLAWLKRNYHALELTIDDSKLWSFRALLRALGIRRRFDWIISTGPPNSVHVAARVMAGATGARWIMDLRDPWVCNHTWIDREKSDSALRALLERRLERNCAARADYVTLASPGIGRGLQARMPELAGKFRLILNGFDGDMASPAQAQGRLRLLYAGTLYLNRNPFPLLEALRYLVSEPGMDRRHVSFTLLGGCERWNGQDVMAWVGRAGLEDVVQVRPPVPPKQAAMAMEQAEVLVNFAQGQPDQIPAKVYDYLATQREILLIAENESDSARITRACGAGRVVEPHDTDALRRTLRELYQHYVMQARPHTPNADRIRTYSREYQNRMFIELLTAVADTMSASDGATGTLANSGHRDRTGS